MSIEVKDLDIATIEAMRDKLLEFGLKIEDLIIKRSFDLTNKMYSHLELIKKGNTKIEKFYDSNGNASHYDNNRLNSLVKFERTYGTEAVMTFCEITADRYRERIGKKDNQSLEQELMKISWYENAAIFFFGKLRTEEEIKICNRNKKHLQWE